MQNLIYYLTCTLIWGSTYLVITYQINSTGPITAVFYRFLISAGLLWSFCVLRRLNLRFTRRQHGRMFFQGLFLFCTNYILIYYAEMHVASGLMALLFMTMVYFNIIGMRFLFKRPITQNVFWGAALGGLGLILVFHDQLLSANYSSELLLGLMLGLSGAVSASIGNLISFRNSQDRLPILATNAWGMLYGTGCCFLFCLVSKQGFSVHWSWNFVAALLYLALFGTLLAFGTYLSLVARIGADKAVYSTVISPIIALGLSYFFEDFAWTWFVTIGVLCCVIGNILTLSGSLFIKKAI